MGVQIEGTTITYEGDIGELEALKGLELSIDPDEGTVSISLDVMEAAIGLGMNQADGMLLLWVLMRFMPKDD
jgi:hypothetical protein